MREKDRPTATDKKLERHKDGLTDGQRDRQTEGKRNAHTETEIQGKKVNLNVKL